MKIYEELAPWWPLFSQPSDYEEEAGFFQSLLERAISPAPRTVLELGSGGGNNASFMKSAYQMTLVDVSPAMLEVSRVINPQCEHIEGDMRTLRLGRSFDAVFVHDAICYMTSAHDLQAAMRTAFDHVKPGGVALFVPDHVRETFEKSADTGGHDDGERALRYLEWHDDPDPTDSTCVTDYAILLRDRTGTRMVYDRHIHGLFSRDEWLAWLRGTGFEPEVVRDKWGRDVFIARRAA